MGFLGFFPGAGVVSGAPSCSSVSDCSPIVIVPVRLDEEELTVTAKATVPSPDPLAVHIVTQASAVVAVR